MAGKVLIIGTFKNQRIRDELYIHNFEVINNNLTSSPRNWEIVIENLMDNHNEYDKIILQITESVLLIARRGIYNELFWKIVDLVQDYQHIVILYEDNMFDKFNIFNKGFYKKYLYYEYWRTDKKKYEFLIKEHETNLESLGQEAREDFFNKYIVKYAAIAEDQEWEDYYGRFRYNDEMFSDEQISLLQEKRDEFHHFQNGDANSTIVKRESIEDEEKWEYLYKNVEINDTDDEFIDAEDQKENIKKMVEDPYSYTYEHYYQMKLDDEIQTAKEQMSEIVSDLRQKGLNIATYKMSTDLIYTLKDFLKSADDNIIFQRYFLRTQIYADEMEKFLCLFEDYILHVKEIQIKIEHFRTAEGIIFTIRSGDEKIGKDNFNNSVQSFAQFLNICEYDINMAKNLLQRENNKIDDNELNDIVSKYSKEARRLKLDIKHEYEKRMLNVKQRFENDILLQRENSQIDEMINGETVSVLPVLIQQYNSPIYINNGTVNYNENDIRLQELFEKYTNSEERYAELMQQLNMLKDKGIAREHKEGAFEKIKRFLKNNSVEITGQVVTILLNYITLLLG